VRLSGPASPVDGSPAFLPRCRPCSVVALEAGSSHPYQSPNRDKVIRRHHRSRFGEVFTEEYVCSCFPFGPSHPTRDHGCCGGVSSEVLIDGGITAGILTKEKSHIAYSFPKVRPHAPNTVQTPSRVGLSAWRRFELWLWELGARMRDHDIKYAVKTGAATAILAAPAFFEVTRPTFMEYRGEWALISVGVVSRSPVHTHSKG
jgi:hypothetical protein